MLHRYVKILPAVRDLIMVLTRQNDENTYDQKEMAKILNKNFKERPIIKCQIKWSIGYSNF